MRFLSQNRFFARVRWSLACTLYRCVRLFTGRFHTIQTRDDIRYSLDLQQLIDLALFLFGSFQNHIVRYAAAILPPDGVVFDIGANVGALALPLAQLVPRGRVHAFEPTDFALRKLDANLALNPGLAGRITVNHAFLSDSSATTGLAAYSSWPLAGKAYRHPVHGGVAQPTSATAVLTLDDYCERSGITRVDFIKIDTDGNEFAVLCGSRRSLARFRPRIVFELGEYAMREHGQSFADYARFFREQGYSIRTLSGAPVDETNEHQAVPRWGTIDLTAEPQ